MTTGFCENYRFLAQYNGWMNRRLYDSCETLSDADRKHERGAFFDSIHRTLNHLVLADQIWLQRFVQCAQEQGMAVPSLTSGVLDLPSGSRLDHQLFDDWQALRRKRLQLDGAVLDWVADMPETYPLFTMHYSNSKGVQRAHPAWQALSHFFNHQTHHRGQVSTLLFQAGIDPGDTDLIALV
jgi:uncharacterized damage-inducible protein DinB